MDSKQKSLWIHCPICGGKTSAGKPGSSKKSLDEKTTYRFGSRSFVVEPVFRQDGPDTLGSILLRLMKSESEAK